MWAQIAMLIGKGIVGGVQASAQWKAAKTNYKQMMNDSDTILQEGKRESANIRDAADRFAKNQIMDFVSSGVTGEGTPALVTRETYTLGNEEADATLKAAEQQAEALRKQAKMTKHQGKIGIASSIFGSASQGASTYMSAKG